MHTVCALVDCNCFFVSCERIKRPELNGRPVVVLSNNDGVIISVSPEAKALGLKGGIPYFKVKPIVQQHQVEVCSPDFHHYAALSKQVTDILANDFSPDVEIYSIDEAFLDLSGFSRRDLTQYGHHMRATILNKTQVPVSIGIAESKTLAKLSTGLAKRSAKAQGVVNLYQSPYRDFALESTPIEDVWGIGWRLSAQLRQCGIETAWDLAHRDPHWIHDRFSVLVSKTVAELQGIACLPIGSQDRPPKSMVFSRSFGTLVTDYTVMQHAVAAYCRKICEKLRVQSMVAQDITVSIRTNKFRTHMPQYRNAATIRLAQASDITAEITQAALNGLAQIYRSGYGYYKAGIMLHGLSCKDGMQLNLFEMTPQRQAWTTLMPTTDTINRRWGNGSVFYGAEGVNSGQWQMSHKFKSSGKTPNPTGFDGMVLNSYSDTPNSLRFF